MRLPSEQDCRTHLEDDLVVGVPVEGADGAVLCVADDLGAVQEVDGHARRAGEDPSVGFMKLFSLSMTPLSN
jgi:hypothetical protein